MSKQILINASEENDYGFDIHPNKRYSPYKCIDCRYAGNNLKQLQCAKTKYMSKVGMKIHQDLRKDKYRPLISTICKTNKQLACSKNALPVHDICNCDNKNMKFTDIFGQAMVFYRELSELIEGETISRDEYSRIIRKVSAKIEKVAKKGVEAALAAKEAASSVKDTVKEQGFKKSIAKATGLDKDKEILESIPGGLTNLKNATKESATSAARSVRSAAGSVKTKTASVVRKVKKKVKRTKKKSK